jgi:hypothetical protein
MDKVVSKLEELIKSTSVGATHGGTSKGDTDGTLSEKKGVKKGYVINIACLLDPGKEIGTPRGDKIEYINYYPKGDVESFAIRIVMGGADVELSQLLYHLEDHMTIEAWMQMRYQEEPLYGSYTMATITEALDYATENPLEKRFFQELGNNIIALADAKDKLYKKKFG